MSFWDIIWLITHGFLQYILWLAPIVKTVAEAHWAPGWWYKYWGAWDWTGNLDAEDRPNQAWCEKFIWGAFSMLRERILKDAKPYVDSLGNWVRDNLGWLPWGFNSFSAWIFAAFAKIGTVWSRIGDNVGKALTNLWYKIPVEIRENWASWGQLFQSVADKAIDWAKTRYEEAKNRAYQLFDWWRYLGHELGEWYKQAKNVLDDFRRDPGGFIRARLGTVWNWLYNFRQDAANQVKSWLGPAWTKLASFSDGPLQYYYDLWGRAKEDLFDFLADPLEFLWDEAEDFVSRKW